MSNYIVADRAESDAAREKKNRAIREKLEGRLRVNREAISRARLFGTTHEWQNLRIQAQIRMDEELLGQIETPSAPKAEWRPTSSQVFETPQATPPRKKDTLTPAPRPRSQRQRGKARACGTT
jgi:hypothetical protein